MLAAQAINAHFSGFNSALVDYAASLEEECRNYLNIRSCYYRREIRWPDSMFCQRRALIPPLLSEPALAMFIDQ